MENPFDDNKINDFDEEEDNIEKIKINFDELHEFSNYEVYDLKLGNLSFLKRKRFSENLNEKDEKIKIVLDKGVIEEKPIPASNYIRWKYIKYNPNTEKNNYNNNSIVKKSEEDLHIENKNSSEVDNYLNLIEKPNANYKMQTNCKMVEWTDGTLQLVIGNEYFDINVSNMDNSRFAVYDKTNDLYVVKNEINKRFIIVPSEMSSNIDSRFKNQNENSTKTKLAYSYFDKNEYNKEDFAKKRFSKKQPSKIDNLKRTNQNAPNDNKNLANLMKRKNY